MRVKILFSATIFLLFVLYSNVASAQSSSCKALNQCMSSCNFQSPCVKKCSALGSQCNSSTDWKAEERRIEQRVRSGSSCTDKYSTCNLNCKGTGSALISCLQRCTDISQNCRDSERSVRGSANSTSTRDNNYSTLSLPRETRQTSGIRSGVQSTTISNIPFRTVTSQDIQIIKAEGGNPTNNKSDSLRKAALMGGQGAMECTSFVKDEKGHLSLKNRCSELINYHYCYDKWVGKPNTNGSHPNPFKCDLNGKPAFSGADSLRPNSTKYMPLQELAVSKRTRVGPCMDVVIVDEVRHNYLSSVRTAAGDSGRGYHCRYYRASFE